MLLGDIFVYMFCTPKFFLGTIELPDASVLLDLLPCTPGKSLTLLL